MSPKTSQSHFYIKSIARFKNNSQVPLYVSHFLKILLFCVGFVWGGWGRGVVGFFFVLKPSNPPAGLLWLHCCLWVPQMEILGDSRPGNAGPASTGKCLQAYLEPVCLWIPVISLAAVSHYSQIFSQEPFSFYIWTINFLKIFEVFHFIMLISVSVFNSRPLKLFLNLGPTITVTRFFWALSHLLDCIMFLSSVESCSWTGKSQGQGQRPEPQRPSHGLEGVTICCSRSGYIWQQ